MDKKDREPGDFALDPLNLCKVRPYLRGRADPLTCGAATASSTLVFFCRCDSSISQMLAVNVSQMLPVYFIYWRVLRVVRSPVFAVLTAKFLASTGSVSSVEPPGCEQVRKSAVQSSQRHVNTREISTVLSRSSLLAVFALSNTDILSAF